VPPAGFCAEGLVGGSGVVPGIGKEIVCGSAGFAVHVIVSPASIVIEFG